MKTTGTDFKMFPFLGDTARGNPLFRSLMVPGQRPRKQPLFLLGGSHSE